MIFHAYFEKKSIDSFVTLPTVPCPMIQVLSPPLLAEHLRNIYSRLTLVVTFWEASHISFNKTFSHFFSLYIVSHTPGGFPICENKFRRFSFRNLWTSKWKIYFLLQKVVTHFFDFIGFMVVKTTGSTSGLTSFLRFSKQCTVAREICKTNKKIN